MIVAVIDTAAKIAEVVSAVGVTNELLHKGAERRRRVTAKMVLLFKKLAQRDVANAQKPSKAKRHHDATKISYAELMDQPKF